jgi:hypothetical protein
VIIDDLCIGEAAAGREMNQRLVVVAGGVFFDPIRKVSVYRIARHGQMLAYTATANKSGTQLTSVKRFALIAVLLRLPMADYSARYFRLANDYLSAAETASTSRQLSRPFGSKPIMLLLDHARELYCKALLLAANNTFPQTHDLFELEQAVRDVGVALDDFPSLRPGCPPKKTVGSRSEVRSPRTDSEHHRYLGFDRIIPDSDLPSVPKLTQHTQACRQLIGSELLRRGVLIPRDLN